MSERGQPAAAAHVKVMSLSASELARSLAVFAPEAREVAPGRYEVARGPGRISVAARPLPGARLGGLLELPRYEVSLAFEGLAPAEVADAVRAFDLAFQRGGG